MTIWSDLEETKRLWKKSSVTFKAVALLSFFLTISSVASLSDVIFAWRGFLADAVHFYRSYITQHVVIGLESLGLKFSQEGADCLVLSALFTSAFLRVCHQLFYSEVLSKREARKLVLSASGVPFFYLFYSYMIGTGKFPPSAFFLLANLTFWSCMAWFFSKDVGLLFTGPLIVAIAVVLILGAINAGFEKHLVRSPTTNEAKHHLRYIKSSHLTSSWSGLQTAVTFCASASPIFAQNAPSVHSRSTLC